MLKPSYAELMDVLNENADEAQSKVTSRYTVVIAAAKRARQIIDGDEPMVPSPDGKPVSTAVDELRAGKIKIVPEGEGTELLIYKQKELKSLEEEMRKKDAENFRLKFNLGENDYDDNDDNDDLLKDEDVAEELDFSNEEATDEADEFDDANADELMLTEDSEENDIAEDDDLDNEDDNADDEE